MQINRSAIVFLYLNDKRAKKHILRFTEKYVYLIVLTAAIFPYNIQIFVNVYKLFKTSEV